MNTPWSGKAALITGGGSGIGRALALELAARGAHVSITDLDGEAAARVAAQAGTNASARALDVRDAQAVGQAVAATVERHGRLDLMVNNAGIGTGGEAYEIPLSHWDRVLDVNVRGVVHGVLAAYPVMVRQRAGQILNVASLAGLGPAPLFAPYAMSKHAVVGLSTSLRVEAAALGVRVSALCPAAIETPLLDTMGPGDLPRPAWGPDVRRLLQRLGGPVYPVERMAREAVDALQRNPALIVIPGRARLLWRLGRLFPGLAELGGRDAVARERATRTA